MKKLIILFCLIYFLQSSYSLLAKRSKSQILAQTLQDQWKGNKFEFPIFFQAYGKIALDELNKYRKLHFFQNKIQWKDDLAEQAKQEAKDIIYKKTFGDHEKFEQYEKNSDSEYFTEIAIKLTLNDHQMPTKRTLAQYILTALNKDYKSYIAQDYSYAGIAVLPHNEPNEYMVILHLAQKANKWSCKKALESGHMAKSVTITNKGKEETLLCDQETDGGGWTLIADKEEYGRGIALIVPIDDKGLDYDEILWEAKPYFYWSYFKGKVNQWQFDQYSFRQAGLRFGDRWYVDIKHQGYKVKYYTYDRTQDVKILNQGKSCFWGRSNIIYDCASKFILTSIPKGERLNAFSDMESAANVAYQDNIYRFYFKVYVR